MCVSGASVLADGAPNAQNQRGRFRIDWWKRLQPVKGSEKMTATIDRTDAEQLETLASRRKELNAELLEAKERLVRLREGMVSGEANPVDVEASQLRVGTLEGTLSDLSGRIASLQGREDQRRAAAAHASAIAELSDLVRQATAATAEFEEARRTGAEQLQEIARRVRIANERRVELRLTISQKVRELGGLDQSDPRLLEKGILLGVDLSPVFPNWASLDVRRKRFDNTVFGGARGSVPRENHGAAGDAIDTLAGLKPLNR